MVGEHNPTAAGAFQAGTEFRNHGLGLNQDVSLRPARTTATPQPSPRSGSERDRHLERDGETGLAALPRSSTLITALLLLLVRQSMASIAQQCLASGCQSQITIDRLPLRNRFSCERQFGSARPSDQFHQRAWRLAIVELRR